MKTVIPGLSSRDWGEEDQPDVTVVNGREYLNVLTVLPAYLARFGREFSRQPLLLTRKWPGPAMDPELVTYCWRAQRCDVRPSHRVETALSRGSAGPGSVRP